MSISEQFSKPKNSFSNPPSVTALPKYMLNYKAYYDNPMDYLLKDKEKSPKKQRKPTFLDGIDPKFLLTKEESAKPREEVEQMEKARAMDEKERQMRKPGMLYDKDKTIRLIQQQFSKISSS